jgi:hypothetical protein
MLPARIDVAERPNTELGGFMEVLLIVAVVLILLSLLGFGGVVSTLRSTAWLILVIASVLIVLAFLL